MAKHPVLCIVGPTAVGKSAVAELVGERIGAHIVSVDSMQVYRGMDIGTAKTPASERSCPLHMVDVASIDEPYSVARFQQEARACIDSLHEKGIDTILCGGTGLYLDAVIDKMTFPHGDTLGSRRQYYEQYAHERGPQALHALLQGRDPESASHIHPHNVRRVARALEMLDEGVSYAHEHERLKKRSPHYDARIWALTLDRDELYRRIEERVDAMFELGLVDEVASLERQGLSATPTASKAIGYKEVLLALQGTITEDEARNLIKRNTRRYAKRQLSWLRRDGRAQVLNMGTTTREAAADAICDSWGSEGA